MAYVAYRKPSKKKRQEIDRAKRTAWGNISPVTKKVASKKVYDRKRIQHWERESPALDFYFC